MLRVGGLVLRNALGVINSRIADHPLMDQSAKLVAIKLVCQDCCAMRLRLKCKRKSNGEVNIGGWRSHGGQLTEFRIAGNSKIIRQVVQRGRSSPALPRVGSSIFRGSVCTAR